MKEPQSAEKLMFKLNPKRFKIRRLSRNKGLNMTQLKDSHQKLNSTLPPKANNENEKSHQVISKSRNSVKPYEPKHMRTMDVEAAAKLDASLNLNRDSLQETEKQKRLTKQTNTTSFNTDKRDSTSEEQVRRLE